MTFQPEVREAESMKSLNAVQVSETGNTVLTLPYFPFGIQLSDK